MLYLYFENSETCVSMRHQTKKASNEVLDCLKGALPKKALVGCGRALSWHTGVLESFLKLGLGLHSYKESLAEKISKEKGCRDMQKFRKNIAWKEVYLLDVSQTLAVI